ncbi:MAG: tRNA 2-thiouridine(34) synthase MnmA [Thermoleophilaceae bacterium]
MNEFADHVTFPRGKGALPDAAHSGAAGGAACGDLIRIAVRIEGGHVAEAGFDASGCAAATAAGSAVVELVEDEQFLDAARVSAADISEALGALSSERRHAAELAADALHRALGAAAKDGVMTADPSERRTLVAMSGGVDSAVAAQLALDRGDETVGVTLELWADPGTDGTKSCCSPYAVTGARALAHRMGVPHITLDLREEFRREVVDDFLSAHADGATPNPCVRCNGLVRFDAMLELAASLGAARLATGHYARIERTPEGPLLKAAADANKDQSYMLARLTPDELERLWFPLAELEKPRVRELAATASLPVARKPESQDLCFLAGTKREDFLVRHRGPGAGEGELVTPDGRVIGTHPGHETFTVGQRKGIGVAAGEPLYVIRKDPAANRVTVGAIEHLATTEVLVTGATLHREPARVNRVKLRYRSAPAACRVARIDDDRVLLELAEPVHGVAPGQTAALLESDLVVGCGIIAAPEGVNHDKGGKRIAA